MWVVTIEVVVVAVHAAVGQALGLLVVEDAGADGHVDADLVADGGHQLEQAAHGALVGAPHGQHDAELGGAQGLGLAGGGQDLVGVEERGGQHRRLELRRLRAEVAVLRAAAGLGRQDALDLDLGARPGQSHLVGQGGQGRHLLVGQGGQGGQLVGGELAALVQQGVAGGGDQGSRHGRQGTSAAIRAESRAAGAPGTQRRVHHLAGSLCKG